MKTIISKRIACLVGALTLAVVPAACSDSSSSDDGSDGSAGAAGSGGGPAGPTAPLSIAGVYEDNFGGGHVLDEEQWRQNISGSVSVFAVTDYDNDGGFVIAQNDANNDFNPSLWSRFDWTWFDGGLYFCQTVFDGATEDDAANATPADATDPTAGGCAGFTWSQLIGPEIWSTYRDNFDLTHAVTPRSWSQGSSTFELTQFNNTDNFLIAQNSADNEFNPGLWSRFEWTESAGNLYFCQVSFDAASEADALAAGPADTSDPATGGCSDFAWSELTEVAEIFGEYGDDFGMSHSVAADTWTQTSDDGSSTFAIASLDNARNFLVAQNASDNAFNPDLWSRFDWTTFGGELYFCQSVFDAATEADAAGGTPPNAADPSADGCGGFAWSRIEPK